MHSSGWHTCASHHLHKVRPHKCFPRSFTMMIQLMLIHLLHCWQTTTHGNSLVCARKCFRWLSGKAVWLWYTVTMTQRCVHERHNNDGCLQVDLTTRLHCTTHHRYMDEGLCLCTCKEIGLFLKSLSLKDFSSFGQYFRRLATLHFNHMSSVTQPFALFTSD